MCVHVYADTMQRAMAGAALAGQSEAHLRIIMRKMTPSSSRMKESAQMSSIGERNRWDWSGDTP